MKKLLKKRYFIPLAVVAVMAIGAVAAYAAFFNSGAQSVSGTETAGNIALQLGAGTSGTSTSFVSSPTLLPTTGVNAAAEIIGSSNPSQVVPSYVDAQIVTVHNSGNVPEVVWGNITAGSTWDPALSCQIFEQNSSSAWQPLLPSGSTLAALGSGAPSDAHPVDVVQNFNSGLMSGGSGGPTSLAANQSATLVIWLWLNGSNPSVTNNFNGQSTTVTISAQGYQVNDPVFGVNGSANH